MELDRRLGTVQLTRLAIEEQRHRVLFDDPSNLLPKGSKLQGARVDILSDSYMVLFSHPELDIVEKDIDIPVFAPCIDEADQIHWPDNWRESCRQL